MEGRGAKAGRPPPLHSLLCASITHNEWSGRRRASQRRHKKAPLAQGRGRGTGRTNGRTAEGAARGGLKRSSRMHTYAAVCPPFVSLSPAEETLWMRRSSLSPSPPHPVKGSK